MKIISRITNLSKIYSIKQAGKTRPFVALNKFNFTIQIGEVVGIIGLNGSGKSTLLKVLSRTTAPTTGKILVKGDLLPMLEVGCGFQPDLSGRENIAINYSLVSSGKQLTDELINQIAEFAETAHFIDEPLKHYSSGMQMRLAFSIAVNTDPSLIIIDEVLAVGDGRFQKKCFEKINQLRETASIILVSHNMAHITEICTKVIYMEAGCVKYVGDPIEATNMYLKDLDK